MQNQVQQQRPERQALQAAPVNKFNALLMPQETWARLFELAKMAFESRMFPKKFDNQQKVFIVLLKAHEMEMPATWGLERLFVINGNCTIDGQGMLSLILQRCPKATIDIVTPMEKQIEECELEVMRPGRRKARFKFTMADATRAGLLSNPSWTKYPRAMLRWRVVSEMGRIVFPDIIAGLYLHEEMGEVVDQDGKVATIAETKIEEAKPVNAEPIAPAAEGEASVTQIEPHKARLLEKLASIAQRKGYDDEKIQEVSSMVFGSGSEPFKQMPEKQVLQLLNHFATKIPMPVPQGVTA